jgi:RNA exonuclease 4
MAVRLDKQRYISLDVECVATGRRHDDRSVCLVAVVDENENLILKRKVKPDKPIVSYLTPLTGVNRGDLDDGNKLSDVLAEVKALLGPDVVLVGQGTKSDIKWLQLEQGKDYNSVVDLGEMFKTYNSRYGNFSYFSLSHEANTLIRAGKLQLSASLKICLLNIYSPSRFHI